MFLRAAVATLGVSVGLYGLVVGAAWAMQDRLLYQPDPVLRAPEVAGPPIQVVHLVSSDGVKLVGWYLPPRGGNPVVLHFNGNAQGLAFQKWRWKRFGEAGVGFFAIAYRGYSGSEGRPSEEGLARDAEAAWAWLSARHPPERIVIHGYSLGSGVAVRLAVEHPSRALVLEAPYTSTADVAKAHFPWLPVDSLMRDRYPSIDRIGKVRVPILIVHGERDSVIPVRLGRSLYAAARQPKTFVGMQDSNHNTLVRDGLYEDHIWPFLSVDMHGKRGRGES